METEHSDTLSVLVQTFRSFFRIEETTHALIQMAVAHDLACTASDATPMLTFGARERLLNIGFTRGLRSIAQRRNGNPFASAETSTPEAAMQILYKQLGSDQPNALQELFSAHFDDLRAYLQASALPRATFLFVCALFVIDAQYSRLS